MGMQKIEPKKEISKGVANRIVASLMEEAGIDPGDVVGVQFFPDRMQVLRAKRMGAGVLEYSPQARGMATEQLEVKFV